MGLKKYTQEEFREIVHKTHHGTIHEKEYLAIADLIALVREDYKHG